MTTITTRIIDESDDDIRLDRWFKRHYSNVPHGELQKAARKGLIRLNGKKADLTVRVQTGQEVSVKYLDLEAPPSAHPKKKPVPLTPEKIKETQQWVIFRNEDVIAINKPAGIAVQGGSGMNDHIDARLPALQFDAAEPPKLVHRLDKDTSGILLLARNTRAATELTKAFATKRTRKIYWALVVGVPEVREGEIQGALAKSTGNYEKMEIEESGKHAITRYRVLEALLHSIALMELEPVTGRTHQLRVHMAELGHPIIGDGKYGAQKAFIGGIDLPRQLHLHARHISIKGLRSGDIDITAPLSPHMKQSFSTLGLATR
jgi:23S rRNA pseudouridine955/2504/2580 synthase